MLMRFSLPARLIMTLRIRVVFCLAVADSGFSAAGSRFMNLMHLKHVILLFYIKPILSSAKRSLVLTLLHLLDEPIAIEWSYLTTKTLNYNLIVQRCSHFCRLSSFQKLSIIPMYIFVTVQGCLLSSFCKPPCHIWLGWSVFNPSIVFSCLLIGFHIFRVFSCHLAYYLMT